MKIVCASSLAYAADAFSTLGDVEIAGAREISREMLADAEILAIRSTTPVTPELLDGTAVRFVGTATIGTDHMDLDYLERSGIHWCFSPGCNAAGVADYVTSALLTVAGRLDRELAGSTLGVIGVGHVGSRVVERGRALGMTVVGSDPPVEHELSAGGGAALPVARMDPVQWLPLQELLQCADYVTLHVPLVVDGPGATRGMADAAFFQHMKPGAVFLNTCRGDVVEGSAVAHALDGAGVAAAVIDTWAGEPVIDPALLDRVAVGTPHIAGYSWEGRVNGTHMVYESACRFLGVTPTWQPPREGAGGGAIDVATGGTRESILGSAVRAVYDVSRDDAALRSGPAGDAAARGAYFDSLRLKYPRRHEFSSASVNRPADTEVASILERLGFRLS